MPCRNLEGHAMHDVSIPAALIAGLVSFLSPCVLPLVPPYLIYLTGATIEQVADEEKSQAASKRAVKASALMFVLGAGTIGIGWDPTTAQVIIEAHPLPADDELDEGFAEDSSAEDSFAEDSEMLRVKMPVGTARAFTQRTREVVDAGRPLCTLCGYPIDPDGHTCIIPES